MGAFSDRIYAKRVLDRIPLRAVAEAIGVSAMAISDLENGKIPENSEVIPKLASYYKLELSELLQLAHEERKQNVLQSARDGDFKTAFAAARKNDDISKALTDFLQNGGKV